MQAAIPLMVAGQLVQGIGAYQSGQYNKRIANVNAAQSEAEGVAQADRIRAAARIAEGRQLGAQAESGFEIGTGSAIDSLIESHTNAELDASEARRQAAAKARAYRSGGKLASMEGKNALLGSLFSGASAAVGAKQDYAQTGGSDNIAAGTPGG